MVLEIVIQQEVVVVFIHYCMLNTVYNYDHVGDNSGDADNTGGGSTCDTGDDVAELVKVVMVQLLVMVHGVVLGVVLVEVLKVVVEVLKVVVNWTLEPQVMLVIK